MAGLFLNPKKQMKTFKQQLSRGKLRAILKMAKIIPVYKKGCKTCVINYRPISRLSHLSKIIEKAVHDRLYRFLEQNNAFYNYQFGFKNNHSMNYALIKITGQIRNACDKNLFTCGVNLDLQKRFHTLNHDILLIKLKYYEIRGTPYKWFQSFLCQRLQYTQIKESQSSLKQYLMESHKALFLDLFCLSYT